LIISAQIPAFDDAEIFPRLYLGGVGVNGVLVLAALAYRREIC
jgi:hypothetical protein